MAIKSALNERIAGIPAWVLGIITMLLAAWYLIRQKNNAAQNANNTSQAAADQTATNLGSASQLANMFEVAGMMPYQGGDTYVNTSSTGNQQTINNPPGPRTSLPSAGSVIAVPYLVRQGQTWDSIAAQYGISGAHLQATNSTTTLKPGVVISVPWLIRASDTPDSLAAKFGISTQHLLQSLVVITPSPPAQQTVVSTPVPRGTQ